MSRVRRKYPEAPIAAVSAVVVDDLGRVLLVRRGKAPLLGQWSLPGGRVELGETLEHAVVREVFEETGLGVKPSAAIETLDRILFDRAGQVQYHYVLICYLCSIVSGSVASASDAAEACWLPEDEQEWKRFNLEETTVAVIHKAFTRVERR